MPPGLLLALHLAACATCAAPSFSGLDAFDQVGFYPLLHQRSGPRLTLEGADARRVSLQVDAPPAPAARSSSPQLLLFVADAAFGPRTVAAGFSLANSRVGLHVCGPEVSVSLALP